MRNLIFVSLLVFLFTACQESDKINTDNTLQSASIVPTQHSKSKEGMDDLWLESLMTANPQEGRELAIKMARKTIAAIQTDPEVRKKLRDDYAEDTKQLISTAEVVAIEFQTVAQANNYWR